MLTGMSSTSRRKIGAVIQIEGAQEVLIGFALARMLGDDQPGNIFEQRGGPQQGLTQHLLLAHVARRRGTHRAQTGGDDRDGVETLISVGGLRNA